MYIAYWTVLQNHVEHSVVFKQKRLVQPYDVRVVQQLHEIYLVERVLLQVRSDYELHCSPVFMK